MRSTRFSVNKHAQLVNK